MTSKNCFIKIPTDNEQGYRRLSYIHWGDESNENVLLCVHGLSRNAHDFDHLAKKLENNYRIIALDVAGRGGSQWLEKPSDYNYNIYSSDVLFLLKELGIRSVDWLGTSMGGIIAMLVGAQNPKLIKKLVLNDIGPFIPGIALDRIFQYVGAEYEFKTKEKAERVLKIRMATFGVDAQDWPHILKHSIEETENGRFRFAYDKDIIKKPPLLQRVIVNIKTPRRLFKMHDVNLWPFWNKLDCPTLVLRGEKSDILPYSVMQEMAQKRNNIQTHEFAGVGHAPMLMNKEQLKVVGDWLLK